MGLCASSQKDVPAVKPTPSSLPPRGNNINQSNGVLGKDTEDVSDLYTLGKVLGKGQFGTTRLAIEKSTGQQFACKSISKRKLTSPEDIEDVRREVEILHHLGGHPNITLLKGAYEDRSNVHLVMELCSGGELFDRIVSRGHYSEKDAASMCRTIVKVVGHCHSLGVMHRDLKPENFLLSTSAGDAALKGCDFGLSVFYQPGQVFHDIVGSAYYVAPEILRRHYGKEVDLWSCGVILYILLSGVPPFWGETEQQIFDSILKGQLDFQSDPWPSISKEAKDCVRTMLTQDPKRRAKADQILMHPWMRENGTATSEPLDNIILKRMQGFSAMNKLKRKALLLIASKMAPEEVAGLRSIFQGIDKDMSGTITVEELKVGLREQGSVVTEEELSDLVANLDADQSGTIDYEEFLAGTLNLASLNKVEHLKSAFAAFDTDGDGQITHEELKAGLQLQSREASAAIKDILAECDKDGDGQIDYEEFVAMMLKGNGDAMRVRSKVNMRRPPAMIPELA